MVDVPSHVQFELRDLADVVADEVGTNFRATNTNDQVAGARSVYFNHLRFDGGRVVFSNDASFPATVEAAAGSVDVAIASGSLMVAEPVSFPRMTLEVPENSITRLTLEIGGTRYTASESTSQGTTTFVWDEIFVNRADTYSVRLLATMHNSATGNVILSPAIISASAFDNYGRVTFLNTDRNSEDAVAGRVQISTIRVATPRFTLSNNLSSTVNAVVDETATRIIFDGTMLSRRNMTVNSISFVATGTTLTNLGDVDFDLIVDGRTVDSKTIRMSNPANLSTTFNTNINLTADQAQTIRIQASLAAEDTARMVGTVVANGTDVDGNPAISSPINTVAFAILEKASISVTNDGTIASQVRPEGANARLTDFTISTQDGTINLSRVEVNGLGFPANQTATLNIAGNTYQGSVDTNGEVITFDDINLSLVSADHKAFVTTNVNTDS
jgi:hypothetical protein